MRVAEGLRKLRSVPFPVEIVDSRHCMEVNMNGPLMGFMDVALADPFFEFVQEMRTFLARVRSMLPRALDKPFVVSPHRSF
jgi:hypothetical protein